MALEFKLPELGENIEKGNVTKVMVAVGDTVEVDQPVLEIETDKAVLEVPSSVAGTVTKIHAKEGSVIKVGQTVLELSGDGAAAAPAKKPPAPELKAAAKPAEKTEPKIAQKEAPKSKAPAAKAASAQELPPEESAETEAAPSEEAPKPAARKGGPVPAAPSVRRLAREIGVDIYEVPGSGPGGRITVDDVKNYSRRVNVDVRSFTPAVGRAPRVTLPDFSRWGDVQPIEMSSVRRRTAENLSFAWQTIPHVTQHDKVDITELERMRQQFGDRIEKAGGKLTVTAIIVKVLASALKKYPQFNSSVDMENNEILQKRYYNIGIAVDTERGLIVPVIRNVDQKTLTDLCIEINELAERARNRRTTLEEMQGGTFTVSNLGGISGTAFTPIVNPPEVAILGIARTQIEPVYNSEKAQFEPRKMLPIALSYDHRVIDGADGARFTRYLREMLENPFLLFLEG